MDDADDDEPNIHPGQLTENYPCRIVELGQRPRNLSEKFEKFVFLGVLFAFLDREMKPREIDFSFLGK